MIQFVNDLVRMKQQLSLQHQPNKTTAPSPPQASVLTPQQHSLDSTINLNPQTHSVAHKQSIPKMVDPPTPESNDRKDWNGARDSAQVKAPVSPQTTDKSFIIRKENDIQSCNRSSQLAAQPGSVDAEDSRPAFHLSRKLKKYEKELAMSRMTVKLLNHDRNRLLLFVHKNQLDHSAWTTTPPPHHFPSHSNDSSTSSSTLPKSRTQSTSPLKQNNETPLDSATSATAQPHFHPSQTYLHSTPPSSHSLNQKNSSPLSTDEFTQTDFQSRADVETAPITQSMQISAQFTHATSSLTVSPLYVHFCSENWKRSNFYCLEVATIPPPLQDSEPQILPLQTTFNLVVQIHNRLVLSPRLQPKMSVWMLSAKKHPNNFPLNSNRRWPS